MKCPSHSSQGLPGRRVHAPFTVPTAVSSRSLSTAELWKSRGAYTTEVGVGSEQENSFSGCVTWAPWGWGKGAVVFPGRSP